MVDMRAGYETCTSQSQAHSRHDLSTNEDVALTVVLPPENAR